MTPATHPGLLGICLSGAGPTILAFVANTPAATITSDISEISIGATSVSPEMQHVGEAIKGIWKTEGIEVEWMALEVDNDGATCVEE